MKIAGLEKMSLVDFDGYVCATIFTAGCNFKCGFCHNSALVIGADKLPLIPEQEVLSYLEKRKGILDAVCISGGEPTLQPDLKEFCSKVKKLGYKIKLDTNGTNPTLVKELFNEGLVDYFAMDIKNDRDSYASIIGFDKYDITKIQETVSFFLNGGVPYEFRTTIIAEFHKEQNIREIGKWIKGADKYFLQKFKNSENCIESHLSAVDDNTVLKFKDILSEYIPTTRLRGYDL